MYKVIERSIQSAMAVWSSPGDLQTTDFEAQKSAAGTDFDASMGSSSSLSINTGDPSHPPDVQPAQATLACTLPFELLAEIMALVLSPRGKWARATEGDPATYSEVLVLCAVCTYWRQVALGTPLLWTLCDSVPVFRGKDRKLLAAETRAFMERSDPLPFCASLSSSSEKPVPDLAETVATLSSAAQRWQRLTIHLGDAERQLPIVLDGIPADKLDMLEELRIILPTYQRWQSKKVDVFLHAPRLRDLQIEMNCRGHRVSDFLLPWAQITRLELKSDEMIFCSDLLGYCTNLVSARISTAKGGLLVESAHVSLVRLPHLVELGISISMDSSSHEDLRPFLIPLELPALKLLSLAFIVGRHRSGFEVSDFVPSLKTFLARSPDLKKISTSKVLTAVELIEILSFTPSLTELSVHDTFVDENFFEALCFSEREGFVVLVPNLEILELGNITDQWDETSLEDFIASRLPSNESAPPAPPRARGPRLKRVKLSYDSRTLPFSPQFQVAIEEFCAQGLEWDFHEYNLD